VASSLWKHSSGKAFPFRVPGKSPMAARKRTKTKARKANGHHKPNGHHKAAAHGHHKPANSNEPRLSSRPMWQGSLRLSLVACPVALYGATSRTADISFHLLNPETN